MILPALTLGSGIAATTSRLLRASLLDKDVMSSTEPPVVRMLPACHVLKVGGRSILDGGRETTYPLVDAIGEALATYRLIIGAGGGVRSRPVFSIGIDLGLPMGVLAELAVAEQADFDRAKEVLGQGDFPGAAALFATYAESYPGGPLVPEAHYLRGEALTKQGDTANAARAGVEGVAYRALHALPSVDRLLASLRQVLTEGRP